MSESWEKKKLTDISEVQTGKHDANHASENGKYRFYTCAYDHTYSDTRRFEGECLILPGNGVNVGEVFYYNGEFDAYQRTYVVDKIKIYPRYLYYYMKHSWKKVNLNKQYGSATNYLKIGNFKDYEVSFPSSVTEQKQIVSILDKAFAAIDQAKANIEKNIQNAEELFQSKLNEVFSQKGQGWEEKPFENVCTIQGGSQPPKSTFIYEPKEGYIRLIQVRDYRTDKYITYIPKEKAKRFCSKDDIMIGRYGPPIFGIFRGIEGAYNVALMKAIPNTDLLDPEYLFWFLQNRDLVSYVEKTSKRAAGQDGVRKERLYSYMVPFPDKSKQKQISRTITEVKDLCDEVISIYEIQLKNLLDLKSSILQKAFTGELTSALDISNQVESTV